MGASARRRRGRTELLQRRLQRPGERRRWGWVPRQGRGRSTPPPRSRTARAREKSSHVGGKLGERAMIRSRRVCFWSPRRTWGAGPRVLGGSGRPGAGPRRARTAVPRQGPSSPAAARPCGASISELRCSFDRINVAQCRFAARTLSGSNAVLVGDASNVSLSSAIHQLRPSWRTSVPTLWLPGGASMCSPRARAHAAGTDARGDTEGGASSSWDRARLRDSLRSFAAKSRSNFNCLASLRSKFKGSSNDRHAPAARSMSRRRAASSAVG